MAKIQWMGRWGSPAVLANVEEAAEEAPVVLIDRAGEAGWDELRADVAQVLRNLGPDGLVRMPQPAAANLSEDRLAAIEAFMTSAQIEIGGVASLAKELDALVRPTLVLNKQTRVVHRAVRTERLDPDLCTTLCGWHWARSNRSRPVSLDEANLAGALWSWCPRCRPDGQ